MRNAPLLLFLSLLGVALFVACGDEEPEMSETARVAYEVAAGFHHPTNDEIPPHLATNPGTPWGNYVGTAACAKCHEEEHRKWKLSFHSRTLYNASTDTVIGDFSGDVVFNDPDFPLVVEPYSYEDPQSGVTRLFMKIRWRREDEGGNTDPANRDTYGAGELPDLSHGTYEILFSFGNRRHQPYVARWPDGRHWVMPVVWSGVDGEFRYSGFRPYVRSCGHCHVTGVKHALEPQWPGQPPLPATSLDDLRFNLLPKQEGWADGAVGCENCHGPGRNHVATIDRLGAAKYSQMLASGEIGPTIWDGLKGDDDHRMDACGRCHNFFTENAVVWQPGPEGYSRDPHRWPIQPEPDNIGWQFYEDGSPMTPCTVVGVYRKTKMFEAGVGCHDCHDPHGTDNWADLILPIENNALCLKCHEEEFPDMAAQVAHSKHLAGSPGNKCVECHMPRHRAFTNGIEVMSQRINAHEFSVPTGNRPDNGPPPSCNVCHKDKDNEWTRKTIRELWADKNKTETGK